MHTLWKCLLIITLCVSDIQMMSREVKMESEKCHFDALFIAKNALRYRLIFILCYAIKYEKNLMTINADTQKSSLN